LIIGSVKDADAGCPCPANALVRSLLRHIFVKRDEVVIIDIEASIEHLGRGTAEYVDYMLTLSEPDMKSMYVAEKTLTLAKKLDISKIFLVGNKIKDVDNK
jgi:CO dehydrogenase maturation factor